MGLVAILRETSAVHMAILPSWTRNLKSSRHESVQADRYVPTPAPPLPAVVGGYEMCGGANEAKVLANATGCCKGWRPTGCAPSCGGICKVSVLTCDVDISEWSSDCPASTGNQATSNRNVKRKHRKQSQKQPEIANQSSQGQSQALSRWQRGGVGGGWWGRRRRPEQQANGYARCGGPDEPNLTNNLLGGVTMGCCNGWRPVTCAPGCGDEGFSCQMKIRKCDATQEEWSSLCMAVLLLRRQRLQHLDFHQL